MTGYKNAQKKWTTCSDQELDEEIVKQAEKAIDDAKVLHGDFDMVTLLTDEEKKGTPTLVLQAKRIVAEFQAKGTKVDELQPVLWKEVKRLAT